MKPFANNFEPDDYDDGSGIEEVNFKVVFSDFSNQ